MIKRKNKERKRETASGFWTEILDRFEETNDGCIYWGATIDGRLGLATCKPLKAAKKNSTKTTWYSLSPKEHNYMFNRIKEIMAKNGEAYEICINEIRFSYSSETLPITLKEWYLEFSSNFQEKNGLEG